jgi:hypothetical protein
VRCAAEEFSKKIPKENRRFLEYSAAQLWSERIADVVYMVNF